MQVYHFLVVERKVGDQSSIFELLETENYKEIIFMFHDLIVKYYWESLYFDIIKENFSKEIKNQ